MFGSNIIEVAIGITFVYVLLALICSTINEWITSILKLRANNLEEGIRSILDDPTGKSLAHSVYSHPLILGLAKKGGKPSYISSTNFRRVLFDVIAATKTDKVDANIETVKTNIAGLPDGNLKKTLTVLIDDAENSIDRARQNIEQWYDESMTRISGWYKRKVRFIIMFIALVIAVVLNADTFMLANALWQDNTLRATLLSAAEQQTATQNIESEASLDQIKQELNALQLPFGWSTQDTVATAVPRSFEDWLLKIIGLLFTAFAISLGAPFWFDFLNKFNSLRSSGGLPKFASSGERKS